VRRSAVLVALATVLLTACGGDDEEKNTASRPETLKAGSKLRVVGREYSFKPDKVVVRGAGPLTVTLDNRGSLAHNVRLQKNGEDVGGTPTFPGGNERSGRVNLEHGNYEMICTVGDHAQLGMKGTVEVR
jgi:plastocyanin